MNEQVSVIDLLQDAIDAANNLPEGAGWGVDRPQHPEDAYYTALTFLEAVTGLRVARWKEENAAMRERQAKQKALADIMGVGEDVAPEEAVAALREVRAEKAAERREQRQGEVGSSGQ